MLLYSTAALPYPTTSKFRDHSKRAQPLPRRPKPHLVQVVVTAIVCLSIYTHIWRLQAEIPPDYRLWHERELAMPQNNLNLPGPQGKSGKYVRISNHVTELGWGNVMQEMILNAHMAFKSGRTFTFYNYTWDPNPAHQYTRYGDNYTPARIPVSAFIGGPIAGDPFPSQYDATPAVSWEFFDEACKNPARVDVNPEASEVNSLSAKTLVDRYVDIIQGIDNHCVEFASRVGKEIFDYILFADGPRLLDIWDELINSPILTEWRWSSLVMSVAEDNRDLIHPQLSQLQHEPLPGLLALHIRHGDYAQHCQYLLKHRVPFHGYNQHASYPDRFAPPGDHSNKDVIAFYDTHCVPEMEYMVERALQVRQDHEEWTGRTLEHVYILTNAKCEWLEDFKAALLARSNWTNIVTSRDLTVSPEQKFVAQAADMMLATRADVFLGNGWSSLTSNVNLLRAAARRSPETTRFW